VRPCAGFNFGDGDRILQIGSDFNFYRINCYRENDREYESVYTDMQKDKKCAEKKIKLGKDENAIFMADVLGQKQAQQ
jgi:hypothetical protein